MRPRNLTKTVYLLACLLWVLPTRADTGAETLASHIMEKSDSLVRARLENLGHGLVRHRHDRSVHRRIANYVEHWPKSTGRILARSARYFPIFEKQLAAAGLPLELKYVAIQESALRPYATSQVGAGGLWQLMPETARELGLTVNDVLDERLDAERGCAAGLRYLRHQYERYENWALAIAAYNCGPGNVNKAIRRSGKRHPDFWQIRRHLPRETANYMPSIIAAVYLMTYYHDHDVQVSPMELDLQMTEAVTVYRDLSLHRVAQVTGLQPDKVIELNPQYLAGYLPGMPGGHRLHLPQRVVPAMKAYLAAYPAGTNEWDIHLPWASPRLHDGELNSDRHYSLYRTSPAPADTTLRQVAARHGVPVDQLAIWSYKGVLDDFSGTAPLVYYRVTDYRPYDPRDRNTPDPAPQIADMPTPPVAPLHRRSVLADAEPVAPPPAEKKRRPLSALLLQWFE